MLSLQSATDKVPPSFTWYRMSSCYKEVHHPLRFHSSVSSSPDRVASSSSGQDSSESNGAVNQELNQTVSLKSALPAPPAQQQKVRSKSTEPEKSSDEANTTNTTREPTMGTCEQFKGDAAADDFQLDLRDGDGITDVRVYNLFRIIYYDLIDGTEEVDSTLLLSFYVWLVDDNPALDRLADDRGRAAMLMTYLLTITDSRVCWARTIVDAIEDATGWVRTVPTGILSYLVHILTSAIISGGRRLGPTGAHRHLRRCCTGNLSFLYPFSRCSLTVVDDRDLQAGYGSVHDEEDSCSQEESSTSSELSQSEQHAHDVYTSKVLGELGKRSFSGASLASST